MGMPEIVYSDQGHNFESVVLKQTLEVFGIRKSHTTAYHPQGNGLVERFNRSLLQLLRKYIVNEFDWEQHLPLALYAYRTAIHFSTGISPHMLMFGREPCARLFDSVIYFNSGSYQHYLRDKLAKLQDLVEVNLVKAADQQKVHYDRWSKASSFATHDKVWLSVPTTGKLQPRLVGEWQVIAVKSLVTNEISNGKKRKVVHSNHLRHRLHPAANSSESTVTSNTRPLWTPPQVENFIKETVSPPHRYPSRQRRPPLLKLEDKLM